MNPSCTFTTIALSELLAKEYPPQHWLIEHLIPQQGISFVAGKPGSAKSFITLEMARAVAQGDSFAGHFPAERGGVLIIDEENSPHELQKRVRLFGIAKELPIVFLHKQEVCVLTISDVEQILNICKDQKLSLIIIDSLIRVHKAQENDASDMRRIHLALQPLLRAGITIILIHHEGKMGVDQTRRGMRGSSELDAMADSVLLVSKNARIITVTQSKLRQDEVLSPFELELCGDNQTGLLVAYRGRQEVEGKLSSAKQAVVETLEEQKELNKRDLIETAHSVFGIPYGNLRVAVDQLVLVNAITKETKAHGAQFFSLQDSSEESV